MSKTTTKALEDQGQEKHAAPVTAQDFPRLLEASKGEIAKVLPDGVSIERVCRMALTLFKLNPDVRDCTPVSILTCVMRAAELGLELGGSLKQAWPVPFRNTKNNTRECTFILGYQGVLELARRSGQFRTIEARVVLDTDEFDLHYSPRPCLTHRPDLSEAGVERGCYAYAVLMNGETIVEWLSLKTLKKIQECSRDQSFWVKWWGEKARNAALKRLLKRQPLSVETRRALEEDDERDAAPPVEARFVPANGPALVPPPTRSAQLAARLGASQEPEPEAAAVAEPQAVAIPGGRVPEGVPTEADDIYATEGGAAN